MKKILLVTLVVLSVVLLMVFLVVPVFAHKGDGGPVDDEAGEAMHQACEDGDWGAMNEAMGKVDLGDMPCHEGSTGDNPGTMMPRSGEMGGHMNGGMGGGMGSYMSGSMMGNW